jgi:hypothetical protein
MSASIEARTRRNTLVASLVSVVATLLGVLVPIAAGKAYRDYAVLISAIFLGVSVLALAGVYFRSYLDDVQAAVRTLESMDAAVRFLPTILAFESREDVFLISRTGDARITWDWEISCRPDQAISELAFPIIYTNAPSGRPESSVVVELLEVNGTSLHVAADTLEITERRTLLTPEVRRQWGEVEYVEYGLLRVPVELREGATRTRIRVQMLLTGAFAQPVEQVVVDVPYPTKLLRVRVGHEGKITRRAPSIGGNSVVARSSMQVLDLAESTHQSGKCRQNAAELIWETTDLKLSYSYALSVRGEDMPGAVSAPQTSAPQTPAPHATST